MKTSAYTLFCMYYLGITPEFKPRFYNMHSVARDLGTSAEEVLALLHEYGMMPEVFKHVDYNVAKAHGKAQEVALFESAEDLKAFCRREYEDMARRLRAYDPSKVYEDVDYDRIWGDEDQQPQDEC